MGPAEGKAGVARTRVPQLAPRAAIGGKGMNSGIRGGLWDEKHFRRMGSAIWLFGWLVHRQTTQRHGEGLVLRGKGIDYTTISEDTGFSERTLQRWMATLIRGGYVSVKHTCYKRLVIRVLNAKKFAPLQLALPQSFPQGNPQSYPPTLAVIGTKNGGFKEGVKIERQKTTTTAHTARRAVTPPEDVNLTPKPLPQRVVYMQTAELLAIGGRMLKERPMSMGELKEELKLAAAKRGFAHYGEICGNAADIAIRRFEATARGT